MAIDSRLVQSAAHAFVQDMDSSQLEPEDVHHFSKVMRIRAGEIVTVSDGAGRWRECRVVSSNGSDMSIEPVGEIISVASPSPPATVGFALIKSAKAEWIVEKLTELGVDQIIPFVSDNNAVVGVEEKSEKLHQRCVNAARQASMQSRRVWLPDVSPVTTLADLLTGDVDQMAMADFDGSETVDVPTILVGPEGGWSSVEKKNSVGRICLGPNVLRSETAALVAGSMLVQARDQGKLS